MLERRRTSLTIRAFIEPFLAAYAARRRRWTEAWLRRERPEPPTETERPDGRRSRTIYDRRQFRFDF
ncbi:hypothetical protein [Limobrevibacterium gyesilva]|uniref:Uncharacterized protein n=1 Tax=Limobrevibacterium gyesilva TaxID=2991712 RepID=A0AA41YRP3_9PROT|nr:hypothetical protein [Limobrevibacterium gyesilva]MCW3477461.1 hypothetical protein [Limobrevibacterium gyesilva]